MNPYSAAALRAYGGVYAIFFVLPSALLAALIACTPKITDGLLMFSWISGNAVVVLIVAFVIGKFNQRNGNPGWGLMWIESALVLLACGFAAACPLLWNDASRDVWMISRELVICGALPTMLAGIFHKGMLEKIAELDKNG